MKASARVIGSSICARASSLPVGLQATAFPTDVSGVKKYLRVHPETPQQLIWLVPQYGLDYQIESNTNWNIV